MADDTPAPSYAEAQLNRLRDLNDWATGSLQPDVTVLFDLPEEIGLIRAQSRNAVATNDEGRFEAEDA